MVSGGQEIRERTVAWPLSGPWLWRPWLETSKPEFWNHLKAHPLLCLEFDDSCWLEAWLGLLARHHAWPLCVDWGPHNTMSGFQRQKSRERKGWLGAGVGERGEWRMLYCILWPQLESRKVSLLPHSIGQDGYKGLPELRRRERSEFHSPWKHADTTF